MPAVSVRDETNKVKCGAVAAAAAAGRRKYLNESGIDAD